MNEKLLWALNKCQERYIGQRAGQILVNALLSGMPHLKNEDVHQVLFYITDNELADCLMKYAHREQS